MSADPTFPMMKGHYIHGTGTMTVYHNRGVSQIYGDTWPYMILHECDQADFLIRNKGADSFEVVTETGVWDILMVFDESRDSADE